MCGGAAAACLFSNLAEADVSKAWAAAKDNLPANTQLFVAIDVAAIVKSPSFAKLFDAAKREKRDLDEGYTMIKSTCKLEPTTSVEGIVLAGNPTGGEQGVAYIQLALDRTKASACLESVLKLIAGKKPVTVKQDGIYTVASVGKDSAYFAWVGPNVVAVSIDPDKKPSLEAWVGQKTFAKSPVAAIADKLDRKATGAGAFSLPKPIDRDVPVQSGWGSLTLVGGTITGSVTGTATDAKAAANLTTALKAELVKDMNRQRTPAAIKKIMGAISITAASADVTIKGSVAEKDLIEAFLSTMKKKDHGGAAAPTPPQP